MREVSLQSQISVYREELARKDDILSEQHAVIQQERTLRQAQEARVAEKESAIKRQLTILENTKRSRVEQVKSVESKYSAVKVRDCAG